MPNIDKELIKHLDSYKRREEYKYAVENEEKSIDIIKQKIKHKQKLLEIKRKIEQERLKKAKTAEKDQKEKSPPPSLELNNQERELIESLRALSKKKQEYFFHLIKLKIIEEELKKRLIS